MNEHPIWSPSGVIPFKITVGLKIFFFASTSIWFLCSITELFSIQIENRLVQQSTYKSEQRSILICMVRIVLKSWKAHKWWKIFASADYDCMCIVPIWIPPAHLYRHSISLKQSEYRNSKISSLIHSQLNILPSITNLFCGSKASVTRDSLKHAATSIKSGTYNRFAYAYVRGTL